MRDIRQALEERVGNLELQIGGTDTWFEQRVEQLKNEIEALKKERESKLAALKSELQLVDRVLQFERRRFGAANTVRALTHSESCRSAGALSYQVAQSWRGSSK